MHVSGVTPEKVKKIHDAGLEAGAWTVNDRAAMIALLDMGIDRLYTDQPRQLLALHAGRSFRAVSCEGAYPRHLQGIATNDRDGLFWSFTDALIRTDLDGKIAAKVPVANHHGDLCYVDGKLYVAVNLGEFNKPAGRADSWVYVYDAGSLKELSRHPTPEAVHGAGALRSMTGSSSSSAGCLRGLRRIISTNMTGRLSFQKRHELASGPTLMGIQTAAFAEGGTGGSVATANRKCS